MVSIGGLSEYAKRGLPTAVKGIITPQWSSGHGVSVPRVRHNACAN
jgi:hypothetical protein